MEKCISELAHHLKQEKLFIESEQKNLENLNKNRLKIIESVYEAALIRSEQWSSYHQRLIGSGHASNSFSCNRVNILSEVQLIEGNQTLGFLEPLFGEFLSELRHSPKLISECLALGESMNQEWLQLILTIIFSSIYGNCILPEDEIFILETLSSLIEIQITSSENPKKLLHTGASSFSRILRAYIDTNPQIKVFLTSSLHDSILELLKDESLLFECDSSTFNNLQSASSHGSNGFSDSLNQGRLTEDKLIFLVNKFIDSIHESMHCFPSTLAWLVKCVRNSLSKSKSINGKELEVLSRDLVFTLFICPAIVTPEPQGIVTAPISAMARQNLMQVAQILQRLAIVNLEPPDQKMTHFYSKLNHEKLTNLLEVILYTQCSDEPPVMTSAMLPLVGFVRSSVMIPEAHLAALVQFLIEVQLKVPEDSKIHQQLCQLLGPILPHADRFQINSNRENCSSHSTLECNHISDISTQSTPCKDRTLTQLSPEKVDESVSTPIKFSQSPKNILSRVKTSAARKRKSSNCVDSQNGMDDSPLSSSLSSSENNNNNTPIKKFSINETLNNNANINNNIVFNLNNNSSIYDSVLIISLPTDLDVVECPGLMSEEKVLASVNAQKTPPPILKDEPHSPDATTSGSIGSETTGKRTRFSTTNSNDDGSRTRYSNDDGEVSIEASEAVSNHSVSSSIEDDVEQVGPPEDNLSDMVSANVSGRGTPNVSGRDTPSSQVTEGDDAPRIVGERPSRPANIQVQIPKPASADIEEKFGRFEIRPLITGDETRSLVSDTWSTDVLGSDSETVESAERENRGKLFDQHLVELDRMHRQVPEGDYLSVRDPPTGDVNERQATMDNVETNSEAWSIDVLTSETDRLKDFDTDDSQSVARSEAGRSDTGRSEGEGEIAGAGALNIPDPIVEDRSVEESVTGVQRGHNNSESSRSRIDFRDRQRDPQFLGASSNFSVSRYQGSDLSPIKSPRSSFKDDLGKMGNKTSCIRRIDQNFADVPSCSFKPIDSNNRKSAQGSPQKSEYRDKNINKIVEDTNTSGLNNLSLNSDKLNMTITIDAPMQELQNKFVKGEKRNNNNNLDVLRKKSEKCPKKPPTIIKSLSDPHAGGKIESNRINNRNTDTNSFDANFNANSSSSFNGNSTLNFSANSLASSESSESDNNAQKDSPKAKKTSDRLLPSQSSSSSLSGHSSTGAIPKSISFDKTAEKGDRDMDGDGKKRGFFKSFKLPAFKARKKSSFSNRDEYLNKFSTADISFQRPGVLDDSKTIQEESSDEILAKYRKKEENITETDTKVSFRCDLNRSNSDCKKSKDEKPEDEKSEDENSVGGSSETDVVFSDIKQKLRRVLSSVEFMAFNSVHFKVPYGHLEDKVLSWLRAQLAESQMMQDSTMVAHLNEAIRCLQFLDRYGRESIVHSLKEDYLSRSPYIAYLIRSRQGLLNTISYLEKIQLRLETDTHSVVSFVLSLYVAEFVEKHESSGQDFVVKFSKITVPDEKVAYVEKFMSKLYQEMERDSDWITCNFEHLTMARLCLERIIMSRVYRQALFPNGDGDRFRDQVLHEHIQRISNKITPNHKALKIPRSFQFECPWPAAQAELSRINIFKTCEDKVRCVVSTCKIIMNLLSMGQYGLPSADDLIPVLVFVIIKANPLYLLSTCQYVDLYFNERLTGEDRYWWTQFVSSVEFIKTVD